MGCARSGGGQLRKGAPCQQHRQAVAQGLRQRLAHAWSKVQIMRINGLRSNLRRALEAKCGGDYGFIEREKGMFSFLGLTAAQAQRLRHEFGVYMLDSSRINVAGINARNLDYVAESVAKVL